MKTIVIGLVLVSLVRSCQHLTESDVRRATDAVTKILDTAFLTNNPTLIADLFDKSSTYKFCKEKTFSKGVPYFENIMDVNYSQYQIEKVFVNKNTISFNFFHYTINKEHGITLITRGFMSLHYDDSQKRFYISKYAQVCPDELIHLIPSNQQKYENK
ncbi:unnamed protein product [Caenorhabditis bovis]|uniref:DUF38 domain-containing protein n=1 Tax=Caenorhabditis bovis TaxID=2654633 RepID=A0A8S1F1X7_9PELO|nr:unnamed protein product [Caenorhabditis bovis]